VLNSAMHTQPLTSACGARRLRAQMAFQGTLYITDKHTCFDVEEHGRKLPITLEHSLVRAPLPANTAHCRSFRRAGPPSSPARRPPFLTTATRLRLDRTAYAC